MLEEVVGNYLDSLVEREFDAPFLSLLRARGFNDIHFLHGTFEFGKDFIAKRQDGEALTQYAFQSKGGDIGQAGWREVRGQLDELRTNVLAHPNFASDMPRRAVLVTTGRLVGGAPLNAQDYSRHVGDLGEGTFEVWDRETLIELIVASPEVGLAERAEGPILALLSKADDLSLTESDIERFSRRWIHPREEEDRLWGDSLEAAVLANRLRGVGRLDLASYCALALLRGVWATSHDNVPPSRVVVASAETSRGLFSAHATEIWEQCSEALLDPRSLVQGTAFPITYPVRCSRLLEVLGLLGLFDEELREAIGAFLSRFILANPGSGHPISDRWAISMVPAFLAVSSVDVNAARAMLTEVIRWIGDHYSDDGLGLAGPYAPPDEEIGTLLGSPFEHTTRKRRALSYAATLVLDLSAISQLWEIYDLALNDFRAVDAIPVLLEAQDTLGQYIIDAPDLSLEAGVPYAPHSEAVSGVPPAPHHAIPPGEFYLERLGLPWDQLALATVLRDRHFLNSLRSFIRAA